MRPFDSLALGATDGADAAIAAASASAHRLQPELDVEHPEPIAVYGMIFLQGAIAAGLNDEPQQVSSFLDAAYRLAIRVGPGRNDYWTAFGPTNVDIYRVSAYVALGDWSTALDSAGRMNQLQLSQLPRERRANHLIDIARAHALAGKTDEAVATLTQADALAPKEVRCRPIAGALVHDLWRRSRHAPSTGLQRLIEHVARPA